MTIAVDDLLWIERPDATEAQLRNGLTAARNSLEASGFSADVAYAASWMPEAIEFSPDEKMTDDDWKRHDAWRDAQDAAVEAIGLPNEIDAYIQLYPAALGEERYLEMLAACASGKTVSPAPDAGPIHRLVPEEA